MTAGIACLYQTGSLTSSNYLTLPLQQQHNTQGKTMANFGIFVYQRDQWNINKNDDFFFHFSAVFTNYSFIKFYCHLQCCAIEMWYLYTRTTEIGVLWDPNYCLKVANALFNIQKYLIKHYWKNFSRPLIKNLSSFINILYSYEF